MKDTKKEIEKISVDIIKKTEGESVSKNMKNYSKKKSEKPNSIKNNLNSGNSKIHTQSTEIKIIDISKPSKQEEINKIKQLEEKIVDYNEKEAFLNLIKYAKKGDRVGFINTMEM